MWGVWLFWACRDRRRFPGHPVTPTPTWRIHNKTVSQPSPSSYSVPPTCYHTHTEKCYHYVTWHTKRYPSWGTCVLKLNFFGVGRHWNQLKTPLPTVTNIFFFIITLLCVSILLPGRSNSTNKHLKRLKWFSSCHYTVCWCQQMDQINILFLQIGWTILKMFLL